jgi:hypothetical protein
MHEKRHNILAIIIPIVILTVLIGILFLIRNISSKPSPESKIPNPPAVPAGMINLTNIKIINSDDQTGGCTEIAPDGVVRIYSKCGTTLDDAYRSYDSGSIVKLMKMLYDPRALSLKKPENGAFYTITIETEGGTFTIFVPKPGGSGGTIGDQIISVIGDIIDDKPPEIVPTKYITGTPEPTNLPGVIPVSTAIPTMTVSPTPQTGEILPQNPFTCDFTGATGIKKPYRVSNVVCSTEPVVK